MPRIQLPVSTERSPISANTGSGASVNLGAEVLGQCLAREPGAAVISIAQLPQMPARQTKSNCSDAIELLADLAQGDEQRHPGRVLAARRVCPVRGDLGPGYGS